MQGIIVSWRNKKQLKKRLNAEKKQTRAASDGIPSSTNINFSELNDNPYISKSDIIGSSNYMTASGKIEEGTIINIKKLDFGGFTLENIRASVARNQNAPLLLGQNVLGRLGKIEIDNNNQVLRITQ